MWNNRRKKSPRKLWGWHESRKDKKKEEIIIFMSRRDFFSADNQNLPDDFLVVLRITTAIERLSYLMFS